MPTSVWNSLNSRYLSVMFFPFMHLRHVDLGQALLWIIRNRLEAAENTVLQVGGMSVMLSDLCFIVVTIWCVQCTEFAMHKLVESRTLGVYHSNVLCLISSGKLEFKYGITTMDAVLALFKISRGARKLVRTLVLQMKARSLRNWLRCYRMIRNWFTEILIKFWFE